MGAMRKAAIRGAEAVSPLLTEFLGVFFLASVFGCSALGSASTVWAPTATAFTVMVAMCVFAPGGASCSGGHFNPAVSLAFGFARKLPWMQVLPLCIAQALGGLLGGHLALSTGSADSHILARPARGFGWFDAFAVEVIFTVVYCFVALNCLAASSKNPPSGKNQFSAMAVGFVVIAGGHAALNISGAFFNPALSVGFGLAGGTHPLWCLLYAGFHAVAAVVAALLFFMVRPEELFAQGASEAATFVCPCFSRWRPQREDAQTPDAAAAPASAGSEGSARAALPARVLSELIGTYIVTFTFILCSGVAGLHRTPVAEEKGDGKADTATAKLLDDASYSTVHWATAAAVLSAVYALGDVSGGHFNPAVTLASMLSGRGACPPHEALSFLVAQAGAAVAAASTLVLLGRHGSAEQKLEVRNLGPGVGHNWHLVIMSEAIFTGALALVVLCMTTVRSPRYMKAPSIRGFQPALAIGMCVAAGGFALDDVSSGVLNPATSLAVAASRLLSGAGSGGSGLAALGELTSSCLRYCGSQFAGGAAAALAFALVHPLEFERDPLRPRCAADAA